MKILDYIINLIRPKCNHINALVDTNEGYCPDCGAYLKKYFYIVRCSCCNIKREGSFNLGEVVPATRFCPNCGGEDFYVEKLEKIDITDIRYAVHRKEILECTNVADCVQIWVEDSEPILKLNLKDALND